MDAIRKKKTWEVELENRCSPISNCDTSYQYMQSEATATTDRVCATKQCTCDNGDPASGAVCNTHNTPQCAGREPRGPLQSTREDRCVSCHSGHWLSGDPAMTGSACPAWRVCTSTNWIAGNQVDFVLEVVRCTFLDHRCLACSMAIELCAPNGVSLYGFWWSEARMM